MVTKPPFTDIEITTQEAGFYKGYSLPIALISKTLMVLLVIWALVWPLNANETLGAWKWGLLQGFNTFYVLSVGLFAIFLLIIAIIPASGKRLLGHPGEKPEFSNFSWFAMMFGAGLGVGLMVYATSEPLGLWGSNPVIIAGEAAANTAESQTSAFRYTFMHYGLHAWSIYVVTGLSLAFYAYTRDMPLTIRSALTPILGRFANGFLGHIIDVLGVVATILGVSVTIGFGVSQLVDGVYSVSGIEWLVDGEGATPQPSKVGLIVALSLIMGLSILSAVSGVGRGIKYLSNLNLVLSSILILVFIIFGSFWFAMSAYATTLVDYVIHFIPLSFEAFPPETPAAFLAAAPEAIRALSPTDSTAVFTAATDPWGTFASFREALPTAAKALDDATLAATYKVGTDGRLFGWQSGWTTFYWAWWIAFSPFVGLFLARISRGRTVREFILGAVIAPSLVCFLWMTLLGGTAIDMEMNGNANGTIIAASTTARLFVTLQQILSGPLLDGVVIMSVVLILTFLVTSADSGILVMNTIMSGGSAETGIFHRIIWGLILTAVIGTLLIAGGGGLDALSNAMIIGALPFAILMVLMCISLIKALWRDSRREKAASVQAAATA
ncbi:MAG TPA: BCCT family transporter [Thiolinea sp.]|nr:BCCT family transporter [Thiolinea sp.]